MMHTSIPPEEKPHVAALQRAVLVGFDRLPLPGVAALFYSRQFDGVVEVIQFAGMDDAMAARWRADEYVQRAGHASNPLWQLQGTLAEVITALLELPRPGHPGAPSGTVPRSSGLVLPGDSR